LRIETLRAYRQAIDACLFVSGGVSALDRSWIRLHGYFCVLEQLEALPNAFYQDSNISGWKEAWRAATQKDTNECAILCARSFNIEIGKQRFDVTRARRIISRCV
jgi:hypothetical protein